MDLNTIGQIIGSYGFPIVACAALFWQNIRQEENHKTTMENLTKVIQENTTAINKVLIYIEAIDNLKEKE